MSDHILDASAVLAWLHRETGFEKIEKFLDRGAISAVNLAEVAAKLMDRGLPDREARETVLSLGLEIVPFDEAHAFRTAELRRLTQAAGLSLADCTCLATARLRGIPAITADRNWSRLTVPVKIQVFR